jgi:hypothetical protein
MYLEKQLGSKACKNSLWRVCSWHKNQRLMQTGKKPDEVGWRAYELARKAGAIIATGHEHAYSRTHLMSDFEKQVIASTSRELVLEEGKSFCFVSGLGGHSRRPVYKNLDKNPWWASVYTEDQKNNFGALFGVFNVDGQKNKARFYFKTIDDIVIDEFEVVSMVK